MKSILLNGTLIWDALQANDGCDFDVLWEVLQSADVQGYITQSDLDSLYCQLAKEQDVSIAFQLVERLQRVLEVYPDGQAVDVQVAQGGVAVEEPEEEAPALTVQGLLERYTLELLYTEELPSDADSALGNWYRKWRQSGFDPMWLFPIVLTLALHQLSFFQQFLANLLDSLGGDSQDRIAQHSPASDALPSIATSPSPGFNSSRADQPVSMQDSPQAQPIGGRRGQSESVAPLRPSRSDTPMAVQDAPQSLPIGGLWGQSPRNVRSPSSGNSGTSGNSGNSGNSTELPSLQNQAEPPTFPQPAPVSPPVLVAEAPRDAEPGDPLIGSNEPLMIDQIRVIALNDYVPPQIGDRPPDITTAGDGSDGKDGGGAVKGQGSGTVDLSAAPLDLQLVPGEGEITALGFSADDFLVIGGGLIPAQVRLELVGNDTLVLAGDDVLARLVNVQALGLKLGN